MVVDGRGDDVVGDRLVEEEALGESVFGDVSDVGLDGLSNGAHLDVFAVDVDASGVDGQEAEESLGDFGTPGSEEPGDAEDFALLHGEADVLESSLGVEGFDAQAFLGVLREGWDASALVEFLASHVVGDLLAVEVFDRRIDDVASRAHDGDALRNRHDLVELVRHEDEGNALRAQLFDDHKQARDLTLGEGGRRLVHDEKLRVSGQGAADGCELLVRDGELFDVGVERERDSEALDDLRGLLLRVRRAEELLLFRD